MDRTFLKLGPITIYWYSVLIISAILIGLYFASKQAEKNKLGKEFIIDLICYLVPVGVIGARIYYVIFKSVNINIILVGIIAFGINSGAYVSEIIRSGIKSIDKGQMEAGLSLGLKYKQVMKLIVLPEAFKNILPSLGNEFITLLKETSVGAYIGIIELTKSGDIIASRTYDYFFPLIIVALVYLILTLSLSKMVNVMERRLNNVRS